MKKVLLFMMLVSGLFAKELNTIDESVLGTVGDYTFVCADDTTRVWAVAKDEMNYKVIWVNIKTSKEEWLKCDDYESYAAIYTDIK